MEFTLAFLVNLAVLLKDGAPLFFGLAVIISFTGILVGRREGWSIADSLYFGFITATTVGYGDMRPKHGHGKLLAIIIAFTGLILTGIVVALSVEAASLTFEQRQTQAAG